MRRTSRYPTRSCVTRAQNNNNGVGGTSGVSQLPTAEVRQQRTRSQAQDRMVGVSSSAAHSNGHEFQQHPRLTSHHSSGGSAQHHAQFNNQMYRNHHTNHQANQQQQHHLMSNGSSMSMLNANVMNNNAAGVFRPAQFPSYGSMPVFNENTVRASTIKFIKLNSYDDVRVLIKARAISIGGATMFSVNDIANYLRDENYRVFLRFCKYTPGTAEQNDCLPKSFNLMINQAAFQVKNKYTFAPYDITSRVSVERSNEVFIKCSIEQNSTEYSEDFYFGLYLVKKVDHKKLLALFKQKNHLEPYNISHSIDLVKKKLNPDDDGDEIAIVEQQGDTIKVSLLCPLSSTRMKVPARSKYCDHVHCFDAESFININDITPRWKCPHCKLYIKLDDMIIDNLFLNILRDAPPDVIEAEIYPDGTFGYIQENKPNLSSLYTNGSTKSETSTGKRKLDDDDAKKNSSPVKSQKVDKVIECITIDSESDSDDDSTITDSPASNQQNGDESNNDSDDSDIMIVYEKIAPTSSKSNTPTPSSSNAKATSTNSSNQSSNSGQQQLQSSSSSTAASMPTFNANSTSAMFNNPNSRYVNTNFDSHRTSQNPSYSSQTSTSSIVSNQSDTPSSDMLNIYSMYKYPNMNNFPPVPTSSSAYGMNIRNPTSSVSSYMPQSTMFSSVGTTSTAVSQSMPNVSSQSLLSNYPTQPSTSNNFLNNYSMSSSVNFNAPSTSTQPMDLTATLANMKTDAFPDFADQSDYNWFGSGSKDSLDFNHRCRDTHDSSDSRSPTPPSPPPNTSTLHPQATVQPLEFS